MDLQEEVAVLVKIDHHMKVEIVVVVNHVHNVSINLKDNNNNQAMKEVVLNNVVKLGEMKEEMIINHLVVIVVVDVAEVAHDVAIMKVAEVMAEVVVVVDVAIILIEILKKVHSNNNNNSQHKKLVDGNKVLTQILIILNQHELVVKN